MMTMAHYNHNLHPRLNHHHGDQLQRPNFSPSQQLQPHLQQQQRWGVTSPLRAPLPASLPAPASGYYPSHVVEVFTGQLMRVPPKDPRSNYYLLVCYVCQEMAKPNQEHTLHYGGIVCYSCRAFFRRAHQKTKTPNFICKRGGTCEVTVASRRRCQLCRYHRCLTAGMTPDAVLTEEQKVVRFRKTISKRRQGSNNQSESADEDGGDVIMPDENISANDSFDVSRSIESSAEETLNPEEKEPTGFLTPKKLARIDHHERGDSETEVTSQMSKDVSTNEIVEVKDVKERLDIEFDKSETDNKNHVGINNKNNVDGNESNEPSTRGDCVENSSRFQNKIDLIVRGYRMAAMQMKSEASDTTVMKLGAMQSGESSVTIDTKEFLTYVVQLSEQFRHFALLQRRFGRLSKNDQRLLLARNTPLYIQLCMAVYFGAPSLQHQFALLKNYETYNKGVVNLDEIKNLEEEEEEDKFNHSNGIFVSLKRFNSVARIFRPTADLDEYSQLIAQFSHVVALVCPKFRAILSYAIIFDADDSLNLSDSECVKDCAEHASELLQACHDAGAKSFPLLKSMLTKMAIFCSFNLAWDRNLMGNSRNAGDNSYGGTIVDDSVSTWGKISAGHEIVMSYTREEDLWLNNQFQLIDEAFRSVAIGEEITNEFFMYSLGVPLSKQYMKRVISLTLERMWRVFNIHPEFKGLSSQTQVDLLGRNGPAGLAVMISRYENCSTGIQQIREGFGELDEKQWEENYLPAFQNVEKVKRVHMKDVVAQSSVSLSVDQIQEYGRVINFLGPIVADPALYKLLMLVALLKPTASSNSFNDPLSNLRSTYLMMVRRRSAQDPVTRRLVEQISNCIESLNSLSKILLAILNP